MIRFDRWSKSEGSILDCYAIFFGWKHGFWVSFQPGGGWSTGKWDVR